MPTTKTPPKKKVIRATILIPVAVHEELKKRAALEDRSISSQAVYFIKRGLADE